MTTRYIIINPPISRAERYSSKFLGAAGGSQVPLGVLYIASFLVNNNFDVKFIDAEHLDYLLDETILNIQKLVTDDCVFALTSTTVCFPRAVFLAKKLKEKFPSIKIIIGGSHVSALPEQTMSFNCFDFGIIGEGEYWYGKVTRGS